MLGNQLFGTYKPGTSVVHRAPLWLKAVLLLALSVLLMATSSWLIALGALICLLALSWLAGIAPKDWLTALKPLLPLFAILLVYYAWIHNLPLGAEVLLTIASLITASKILLTTTPIPRIIDGFVRLCIPLKIFEISPDRIGLAIALMLRSIPVIMNEYTLIKQAHQARGLSTWPHRLLVPLVVATVGYAQETGDALAARGLDSK